MRTTRLPLVLLPALALALPLSSSPARADDVTALLAKGPLVRLETDKSGKFKEATCIADVDASVDTLWGVLVDYESYRYFLPRIEKLDVARDKNDPTVAELDFKLDTPLVATRYTNRYVADAAQRTIQVRQVKGDLDGSRWSWRIVPVGDGKSRLYYSAVIRNFSSLAERFEDDQQTLTIGINVVSLMAGAKAIKERAEQLQRTTTRPSGGAAGAGVSAITNE